jgi:hypothetical protein
MFAVTRTRHVRGDSDASHPQRLGRFSRARRALRGHVRGAGASDGAELERLEACVLRPVFVLIGWLQEHALRGHTRSAGSALAGSTAVSAPAVQFRRASVLHRRVFAYSRTDTSRAVHLPSFRIRPSGARIGPDFTLPWHSQG